MALLTLSLLVGFGPAEIPWADGPPPMAEGDPVGSVFLSDDEFTVQTKDTVDYVYEVGSDGMEVGDAIRIEDPILHGMRWSKWGSLHTTTDACEPLDTNQDASGGLVTAFTRGDATLTLSRNTNSANIHDYAYTEVVVESGSLEEGDRIFVTVGDQDFGDDCGHQFPDRAFAQVEWPAYEKLGDATEWTAITPTPVFTVTAQSRPTSLSVVGPSYVVAGEPFLLKVSPLDDLGNPVLSYPNELRVDEDYGGESVALSPTDGGFHDFEITIAEAGVHRIPVTAGTALEADSNPIVVLDEAPDRWLYWGDIHVHHGNHYTDDDGAVINENHEYARDIVGMDVVAESVKWDPIEMNSEELWEYMQDDCVSYTSDDYLVLLANEWMGTEVAQGQGHHNLYYDACEAPFASHDVQGLAEEDGLYQWMEELLADEGTRSVVVPHAMLYTGNNWVDRNDELRTTAEIYSEWGNSASPWSKAGSVGEGIANGLRMGFIAASDNHDGWMGNPYSKKNDVAGLAAFWSADLSRDAIFESLYDRQTYATTGPRIVVEFQAEDGGTALAGQEYVADDPVFHYKVHGTSEIERVQLIAMPIEGEFQHEELYVDEPFALDVEGEFDFSDWDESDLAVWLVARQDDGEYAWSSPIWLTIDCERDRLEDPADRCPDPKDTGDTDSDSDEPDDTDPPTDDSEAGDDSGGDGGGDEGGTCGDGCASGGSGSGGLLVLLGTMMLARRRD